MSYKIGQKTFWNLILVVVLYSPVIQTYDICTNEDIKGTSGVITSPNYPLLFTKPANCSKTIIVPESKRLMVYFRDIEVEFHVNCTLSYLEVLLGDKALGGAVFCGNRILPNFTTNENVTFKFYSNGAAELTKFEIKWSLQPDCGSDEYRCWDGTCLPSSKHCDGVSDCADQSDEIECAQVKVKPKYCGKNSVPVRFLWDLKVVGGDEAAGNSYPWMVKLLQRNGDLLCGGSIVSERWILTAAHCLEIFSSVFDFYGQLGDNQSTVITFNYFVLSPEYDSLTLENDIALIMTSKPINFNHQAQPICLSSQPTDWKENEVCIAAGWGKFYSMGPSANKLYQVRVSLVNHNKCKKVFNLLTNSTICAGNFNHGGYDTCQGDSGGPLMCYRDGSWVQKGVTSYGDGCAKLKSPGIYTNVGVFYKWIMKTFETSSQQQNDDFIDICGNKEITEPSGKLTSPNFPLSYGPNLNCTKTISVPKGKLLTVFFELVDIEIDSNCIFEKLEVIAGNEIIGGASFCGNRNPPNFTTDQDVTFKFLSDDSAQYQGFLVSWLFVTNCGSDEYRCWDGTCLPSSKHCDGVSDCTDQSDEIECAHIPSTSHECGKNSKPIRFTWDHRISGGSEANKHSYPWAVQLRLLSGDIFCGASLLSNRWILTAAHCIATFTLPNEFLGMIGSHEKEDPLSVTVRFSHIIIHPEYDSISFANDIALLKTEEFIKFNEIISPICWSLPSFEQINDETCLAIGWGKFYDNGPASNTLFQVQLKIISQDLCKSSYSFISNTTFCAGDIENGERDTCDGDSGGPLICFRDGKWIQIGISSYRFMCSTISIPGIYTNVTEYIGWISQYIELPTFLQSTTTQSHLSDQNLSAASRAGPYKKFLSIAYFTYCYFLLRN